MTKESLQSSVIINHNEGVTSLLLNQKNRLNALSADMVEKLILGLEEAVSINANLVIFRGEGSSFSAGLDLSNIDKQSDADLLHRFVRIEQLLQIIYKLPITTLALVHGKCFGAAADIVSVCKHRVASPETSFRMPGLQFGIVLGTRRLAQLIGTDKANEFLETSRIFSADEGLKSRFLTSINPADNWPEIINRLTKNATNLNSTSKASLLEAIRDDSQLDNDLATLVRSAIQPGLAKRIEKFIKTQVKK